MCAFPGVQIFSCPLEYTIDISRRLRSLCPSRAYPTRPASSPYPSSVRRNMYGDPSHPGQKCCFRLTQTEYVEQIVATLLVFMRSAEEVECWRTSEEGPENVSSRPNTSQVAALSWGTADSALSLAYITWVRFISNFSCIQMLFTRRGPHTYYVP